MFTRIHLLTLAALLLGGCSAMTPADKEQLAVTSAGDLGALGCAMIVVEANADDLQKARVAAAAANTVLADPTPNVGALAAALQGNMPPKYVPIASAFLARLKVRLDESGVIPRDSVAYAMAQSFVSACAMSLAQPSPSA